MRTPSRTLGTMVNNWRLLAGRVGTLLLIVLMCSSGSAAYSVLTHEEIVDLLWTDDIRPLLAERFPDLTEDQIKEAHAYAYGGAVIQDLGYYPFGSKEFSDLVHYVRSGDFVRELLLESQDANEYAFALGALSHYAADIAGHPAVNQAVAIEYPKLRAKVRQVRSLCAGQDRAFENRVRVRHVAGREESLCLASNTTISSGSRFRKSLLERVFPVVYGRGAERRAYTRGSGGRLVSLSQSAG